MSGATSKYWDCAKVRESNPAPTAVMLRRKSPKRVRLRNIDRLLLVWLYRIYPSLLDAIIIVQSETAVRWHRRGFRAYWRWKSGCLDDTA